jgi:alkanesulfonate monooxygenase SsuD/methylene tetrahydromethanopterin reductase-like flavin-dependent oxidoreductase (luciferase family)
VVRVTHVVWRPGLHSHRSKDQPTAGTSPIWLGSYGPKALALTGELADGWIPTLGPITFERALSNREIVRSTAHTAGRDPDSVTCACNVAVRIDPKRTPTPERAFGSIPAVVQRLVEIIEAGSTFLVVAAPRSRTRNCWRAK